MITPKEHPIITPFLMWYIRRKLKKHFYDIHTIGENVAANVPLIAIGNHISWWDGFFVLHLAHKRLNRKLYVMMLEEQLKSNIILRYGGAFSIKKGTRDTLESLRYSMELLQKPNSMVLFFPQGKIHSIYDQNFQFESGLEFLLKNNKLAPHLLFIANLIEYGSEPKPTLYIYYKEYIPKSPDKDEIAAAYTLFYQQCIDYNITNLFKN